MFKKGDKVKYIGNKSNYDEIKKKHEVNLSTKITIK